MAAIHDLLAQIQDEALRERIEKEIDKLSKTKKFGLVFEEHMPECTPLYDVPVKRGATVAKRDGAINDIYVVQSMKGENAICMKKSSDSIEEISVSDLVSVAEFGDPIYPYLKPLDVLCNAPDNDLWHSVIEADNYHALQLLEYLYAGKIDCIYIDPPYNTGAKDWKYNNDYVDSSDSYRHSKWLSFMEKRLKLAKKLLNPKDSVLIVTIDEKEYLHLGCLLEEVFSDAKMQMISSAINGKGVARDSEFARVNEYIFVVRIGEASVTPLSLPEEWMGNVKTSTTNRVRWGSLMRSGSGALRTDSPGCFYPIYISKDKKHFCGAGDVVPPGVDRNTVPIPKDVIALFPIHDDGVEGRWQYSRDKYLEIQEKGYVRISTQTAKGKEATLRYISEGWQKKVESGVIKVIGKAEDGSVLLDDSDYEKEFVPGNQWWIPSHDATEFGSKLLTGIIGKSTHNRRERPVYGHCGWSRGRFYYRITTFEGRPWDARDPHKTTFMALKHAIRLSIWRKQKETPGVEKAPGVSSPQRKGYGELRFGVRPGHPRKAVTSISQAEALAHGLTHLHHLVFAAVLARELDWCAALQDAREDARPWGVVGIGLRSDVWVEVRRDDHRPAVLVTRVDDVVDMPHDVIGAAVRPQVVDDEEVILEEARLRVLALVERHRLDVGHDVLHAGLQRGEPEVDDPVGDCRGIERLTCAHLSPEEQPIHVIA